MKQPIDYFNHAYQGREQYFDAPTNIASKVAQWTISSHYKITDKDYDNFLQVYKYYTNELISGASEVNAVIAQFEDGEAIGLSNFTRKPDDITYLKYNKMSLVGTNQISNEVLTTLNSLKFEFKEAQTPYYTGTYTGGLNKVMIKAKRFKDVFDKSSISSMIETASGKSFDVETFFNLYGNMLVPVNEEGLYIPPDDYFNRTLTRPYIAYPINENNEPLYNLKGGILGGSNPLTCYYPTYNKAIIAGETSNDFSDSDSVATIPFSVLNGNNIFPFLPVTADFFQRDLWNWAGLSSNFNYAVGDNQGYNPTIVGKQTGDFYIYTATYTNVEDFPSPIVDRGLYFEDNLSLTDRQLAFTYEGQDLHYCMFNKQELENYFSAFGVGYTYLFPFEDEFVQGQKVRHPSLINQATTQEVKKVRRKVVSL